MNAHVFDRFESEVRSYCRSFPTIFARGEGVWMTDVGGRRYLDLLSGAGTLNYGHNNPAIVGRVIDYLTSGGIVHSLDLHTEAKANFIDVFQRHILSRRQLNYKMQFPGPTGTNAIEAALKLARKVTGRTNVVAFTNGFHGMTLGALAATANPAKRAGASAPLANTTFMPYDGFLGDEVDTLDFITPMLLEGGSGVDRPAAILVEMVQGEGGLNTASASWVRRIAVLARELGAILIIDDIQAGNGRTGSFFSFEPFGIEPDIVVLSKSLSGFGTPFSLVLIRPDLDRWQPGEHNGTFRGNNLAFVGAAAAIETYWTDDRFVGEVAGTAALLREGLLRITANLPGGTAQVKGRGLFIGLSFAEAQVATALSRRLFAGGVIAETCGRRDEVLKLLPPLTIGRTEVEDALALLGEAVSHEAVQPRLAS
ncbi:diaminobutyrate--2-oxoglutarate transaminase [Methylobacterium sp. SyP6R]|uniref:diaminobutyrate--2-oxoglutarate transaminase n=1 Tax=Methylobacterium sp. SyP6R TaxID=2718876 RepID=UPI001F004FFD|nr:diaminobutyrate--2-oxoglutarate transaminase [Methylobacterium sp. SyP6R]MCF4130069.1 diaminobutyrate--2-oxoglutarate transaminase [Methylobacterium sp. SyP6R]